MIIDRLAFSSIEATTVELCVIVFHSVKRSESKQGASVYSTDPFANVPIFPGLCVSPQSGGPATTGEVRVQGRTCNPNPEIWEFEILAPSKFRDVEIPRFQQMSEIWEM